MKNILTLLLPFMLLINSCKDSSNPVNTNGEEGGKIKTSTTVESINQSIGTAGGTIKILKSDDPLNGFELTVEANSFDQTQDFKISYSTIKSHELGEFFNPISPLIKITGCSDYANYPVRVKIPIALPAGYFAMAFFYNDATGELEGIPIEDLTNNYITISTKHFIANKSLVKPGKQSEDVTWASVVVSMIEESKLNNQNIIESGFKPGIDDWEFVNFGSYIASGGHCAGQSISSIWYYIEKKKKAGAAQLFHLSDKVNDPAKPFTLWEDNPKGYRFASVIQTDVKWNDQWIEDLKMQYSKPDITFKAFALSILVMKNPQLVLIRKSTPEHSAHAMIIYKVDYPNKKLYVADPNYPGNRATDGTSTERVIEYKNGVLGPYMSGLKANDTQIAFDQIAYFSNKAFLQFEQLASRWTEFENGTIGQDKFPKYKLYADSINGTELYDNYTTLSDSLNVLCYSTESSGYISGTNHLQNIYVYDQYGNKLAGANQDGKTKLVLKRGTNYLGFYIMCTKGTSYNFVDFKWLTIINNNTTVPTLKITPDTLDGLKNKKYVFTATLENATLPQKTIYYWGMDSHGHSKIVYNDNTLEYRYTQTGNYTIQVILSDSTTGQTIASGIAHISIREPANNYECLISSWLFYLDITGDMTFIPPETKMDYEYELGPDYYYRGDYELNWEDNVFSVNYTYGIPPISTTGDTLFVSGQFEGTISKDGQTLTSFVASEHIEAVTYVYIRNLSVSLENVPITSCNSNSCSSLIEGPQVGNYIKDINMNGTYIEYPTGIQINYNLESIDYNATYKPRLSISFAR